MQKMRDTHEIEMKKLDMQCAPKKTARKHYSKISNMNK